MSGVFLVAAKRTPFGAFGGSLKALSATDLGTHATKAALESINLDPEAVDSVFFGNVIQAGSDAAYLARHVGLKSGCRIAAPALTINRLCGSGFESVVLGAQSIMLGESDIVVCGGAENMSDAPLCAAGNDARWGVKLGAGLSFRDRWVIFSDLRLWMDLLANSVMFEFLHCLLTIISIQTHSFPFRKIHPFRCDKFCF